ncbi:ATP-binding cassette domain-containing protein [Pelagicoccus albus]|uniref:ABC transporter ATP-binding protein n=1 Tax=Pelagicoccus albus TaxID=415222 RepID=A0A7X1B902_9BACT|nr:ABC transporter ATP-binding protein [Pelagicoccus albus]
MVIIDSVTKKFGEQFVALQDISLTIDEGEFVAIIGPSGCGKTTLLRLVADLEKPTEGEITIEGHAPKEARRQHEIGLAFQRPALIDSRTALKNVEFTLEVAGLEGALDPKALLDSFGLGDFYNYYPHQLSGGMQQRVNIACACVHNPRLLLLDEPFGALDEMTRERMILWMRDIHLANPRTTLLITHSIEEAVLLADRIVVLSAKPGRISEIISIPRDGEIDRTSPTHVRHIAEVRKALHAVMGDE